MKHIAPHTALALSLTLGLAAAPLAAAQPAALEEEVAQTPSGLTELLGPDGLEAAQCEFYLRMDLPGSDESGLMHWKTAIEHGNLVFTMRQIGVVFGSNTERQVFSAEGEFIESSSHNESPDYKMSEVAVREGDQVRVTRSSSFDGEADPPTENVHDYAPMENAVATSWLPIVFAYHFRAGNDIFTVRMSEDAMGEMDYIQVFYCEDVGTEMIELGGEEHEAHVLMVTMSSERGGEEFDEGFDEEEQLMQMYVLNDGSIARMHAEMEGMTMSAEAITAEEAEQLMQDAAGAAGDAADDAADAVEDAAE